MMIKIDDTLVGVIINSLEEKEKLKMFCIKNNIPLTYPLLFEDYKIYYLWAMNKNGVGLCGTSVMMVLKHKNLPIYKINDLMC